jgi:glycosyltransferase involved in cell wall biosynthesis
MVHQNFPGQFKHLVEVLIKDSKNHVVAFTMNGYSKREGLQVVSYKATKGTGRDVHPWAAEMETKIIRGEAAYLAALSLKTEGFNPEIILAHPGWGESLFLKEVWPNAKLIIYCEFYYAANGLDIGFDPEFPADKTIGAMMRAKNFNNLMHIDIADVGISPTVWQKLTYPEFFRHKIRVVHDGINTDVLRPNPNAKLILSMEGTTPTLLTKDEEIITFVNRNLEPYRGYHKFMRALPKILQGRPKIKILIVGGDGVSYGALPTSTRYDKKSWKEIYADELKSTITNAQWKQIHFLGNIEYQQFLSLLQISRVHVYLTYPFILSWSLIEAMSIGCAIVGSRTGPVQEVIEDGKNGVLADFFDENSLADAIKGLLDDKEKRMMLGKNARDFAVKNYDLNRVCLPKLLNIINSELRPT